MWLVYHESGLMAAALRDMTRAKAPSPLKAVEASQVRPGGEFLGLGRGKAF